MGEVVNFRLARKERDRKVATQAAKEARALHGRTKAQRATEQAESDRLARHVEQSRRETAPSDEAFPAHPSENPTV